MFKTVVGRRFNKSMTTLKDIHKEIDSVYEFSELLLNNNEMTQPNNRLCCAQFLYYNFDLNPLNNEPLLYRQKLFGIMPKAQEGKRKKEPKKTDPVVAKDPAEIEDIMVDLCSLLNGGGGVLLFDCEQQYLEVRPVGECYF